MCGIAGKLDFSGQVDPSVVEAMCSAMEHRGPDSRGIWRADSIALGMQRLAIIDVAGGEQPIFNEDRSIVVVMNGEIYNFQQLRTELIAGGHTLTTHTDTEVLVHLYEDYGERLVDRLRGMFAFAIWDSRQQRLLLGRDRVGKKPLFIARKGPKVWFASEIMALLQDPEIAREPDPRAIISYLTYQYVPHPLSAFAGVTKLAPASTMLISDDEVKQRRYWSLDYGAVEPDLSEHESAERLRDLLWEATRLRMVSEVPLGAFLSGGVDSSAVVAAMADQSSSPVKTFSIGFPDAAYDEAQYARVVAQRFSTDHHEFVVEPSALDIMGTLARHYGEPFADPSAIPSFFLAKLTSQHVTVALNGDGGDESFGGYGRYMPHDVADRFDRLPRSLRSRAPRFACSLGKGRNPRDPRRRAQRLAARVAMDAPLRYASGMSAFPAAMRDSVVQPDILASVGAWAPEELVTAAWESATGNSRLDRMLETDVNTYLPGDLLVKMDIATMAYSVEARSPFLDHHLMEFAARLRPRLKSDGQSGKILLKSAMRNILPDEILDRPKMGFGVPLSRWFREDLRDLPREVLLGSDSRVHAYVKPASIAQMIGEHQARSVDHSLRLWVLLQLETWHREVVESPILAVDGK